MLRKLLIMFLTVTLLFQGVMADSVTLRQVEQDRQKQLAANMIRGEEKRDSGSAVTASTTVPDDAPKFVRLPDGRIVPYGPGIVCTENCVEPYFIERTPVRPNLWVWGVPLLAGGLLAGLMGGGVIGGGNATAGVSQTPVPTPPISVVTPTPLPTPITTPTPSAEVPEPSTFILLGLGMAALLKKRGRRDDEA
ncbi:MAG: PEP-CTERM sorting domain-containing protein [Blastocatellia bacterium]